MMSRVKQRVTIGCPRSPLVPCTVSETAGCEGGTGVRMRAASVALLHINSSSSYKATNLFIE